jgi:cation diffusion facilitator family transporter
MAASSDRDRQVRRVILIEGLANLSVLLLKTWVGATTGSMAVLGDALHSLTDVANNVVAWVVIRISAKPPDRNHPYGHRKFEGLAVFILATLLVVLSVELASRAIVRDADVPRISNVALAVMLVVLAVNIGLSAWQRRWAKKLESDILLADASHTFSDVLTTIVVIVGWQLSARGYVWLDTLTALGVAGIVMYMAYRLFRSASPVLVDAYAVEPEAITARVLSIPGVSGVRRVRTRYIGPAVAGDVVVSVDSQLTTDEAHAIADRVEDAIERDFGIADLTVHIEPDTQTSPKSST